MDKMTLYRQNIKRILEEYACLSTGEQEVEAQLSFDDEHGHYQLMHVGWQKQHRVYGCVIHMDLKDGKVWIQHNGTEADLAEELMAAGVAREDIVLGFRSPAVRQFTGYAAA